MQDKSLSSGQIALWYALMYINNRSQWQEWFTVANKSLESNSGLSRQGILKARNALKQFGLLDFQTRGTKSTAYKLIAISNSSQSGCQNSSQSGCQDGCQDGCQNSSTLNRQDKNRQEKNKQPPVSPILDFYEQNIGPLSRTIAEDIRYFQEQEMETELLKAAIRKAVDNNVRKWSYAKRILLNWLNQGIKTVKEMEQDGSRGVSENRISGFAGQSGGNITIRLPHEG